VILPTGQEFIISQGVPALITWPISGIPSRHKAFLEKLLSSSLCPGELKQTRATAPCAQSGLLGISQGIEIPFDGPIADVVNFLAELHTQSYQYRSLKSYRSAISLIHKKVNGHPIGQHPLVSRALKRAYHSRLPQPSYNTFGI